MQVKKVDYNAIFPTLHATPTDRITQNQDTYTDTYVHYKKHAQNSDPLSIPAPAPKIPSANKGARATHFGNDEDPLPPI